MKTILISKQSLAKTYSGACRTVHEQIRYFSSQGFKVHTISEDPNVRDIQKSGGISHKSFRWPWQKKYQRRLQFSNQTAKLVESLKPKMVIGHGDFQKPDVHFVHNCVHLAHEKIHGTPLSEKNELYKIHTPILKNQQFKHLVANSKMVKDELAKRFSIPMEKISVVYPSVDEKQFKPLGEQIRNKTREKLGVKKDEFIVGLVTSGNFKKRGVDRFLKAIGQLPKEIAGKSHFVFVGKDKIDLEYQSPYKDRIRTLPVIQDVEKYFNALDVFVLPARIEEFGRVVAEAMACGTPVITTKWVGASELLGEKSKEFIYDGESIEELSHLIEKILKSPGLRSQISQENIKMVSKIFESNIRYMYDQILDKIL